MSATVSDRLMFLANRRQFLRSAAGSSAAVAVGAAMPQFLVRAAETSRSDQRVLVVIELAGGNDGLNTIVPYADDAYRAARPKIGIPRQDLLVINDELGLHPGLRGFADLIESGQLAIVQGVGYPNPNRSHFESMDIWHSCQRKDETRSEGWLGRYFSTASSPAGNDPPGLHLGGEKQPFALMSRDVRVASVQSLEQFRLQGYQHDGFKTAVNQLVEQPVDDSGGLLDFVHSSTQSAIAASGRLQAAEPRGSDRVYPTSDLGRKLQTVAQLIAAGLQTRVYYVRLDGFDTHANQAAAHSGLLRQLSEAVQAFVNDQIASGNGDRVLVMGFSEFGRRVAENASGGTDHGTAGPMFFAGTQVTAGPLGETPSLHDLEQGDLKFHIDFRRVYATVLHQWLQCPSENVLLGKYAPIKLLA